MKQELCREEIGGGVYFSALRDPKFKHNSITAALITPLEEETVTANAILPFLLRKGSRSCPDMTRLKQRLCDLYGASLGADVIKMGEYQILTTSITGVDDRFALAGESISAGCARLLGEILLDPNIVDGAFPEADLQLERQYLIDTIEAEINEKRSYALNRCRAVMCRGTRLAIPKYGWVEKARALTAREAAQRYRALIRTARVEIIFTGCGDPAGAREEFARLFAGVERSPAPFTPAPIVERAGEVTQETEEMDIAQSKMVLGFRAGAVPGGDTAAVKLMTFLYGGSPFSRLFIHVREKKSLCYYCAARFDQDTGIITVDIGVEKENRDKAREAILEQLSALAAGDFTEEELAAAKLSYVDSLRSIPDSLGSLAAWDLAQILRGGAASPEEEADSIRRVSREAVVAAAGRVTLDTVYFLTSRSGKEAPAHE